MAAQEGSRGQAATLSKGRRRVVLGVIALALMMVVSAVSGLNVALPDLARDTGATQTQLQWIVDAYTLVFAGLLLPAGALGDRFGRRAVLLIGLLIFGTAAAFAMFVDGPTELIILRAVMGAGASAVMPVTLSIISTSFPPEERGRAVGVWVGVAGAGAVIGLFGSGTLLHFFDWNSFFGLNVVLAVLAVAGTALFIPRSRDPRPGRLDPLGALLSLLGVATLIFAIIEGPDRGWTDPVTVAAFTVAIASLVGFVRWELRRPDPMLDPRLFKLRGFGTGSLSLTVQFFAAFGFFFIVLQYLQFIAGKSPLQAALALAPMPFVLIPLARKAPAIAQRFGLNRTAATGLTLMAVGLGSLALLDVEFVYWKLAIGLVFFAAGMALAGTPATTAIVSSLPASKQGVASAVNDISRELGSAIGIAVLGSVLSERYRTGVAEATAGLPPAVAERAGQSIAFVQQGAGQFGAAGQQVLTAAERAFVDATGAAMLVAAAVLLVTAVYVALRGPRHGEVETAALAQLDGGADAGEERATERIGA